MNPSMPSSPQQDPSFTSLCHILIKVVYLFGFFFNLGSCSLSSVGDHLSLLHSIWAILLLLQKHHPFSPLLLH